MGPGVRAEWAAGKDCQLGLSEVFFSQVWEGVCVCVCVAGRGAGRGAGGEKGLQCCLSWYSLINAKEKLQPFCEGDKAFVFYASES